jgi:type I restriction enzyme S subunit
MNWTTVEFESLYSIPSRNGLNRPSGIRGKGYKFINMGELFGHDRIGSIEMERVEMNDKELATMLIEEGDLLFARQSLVLSGAGKCSIVKEVDEPTTFESHLIRVRLKRELANPYFYHYYFKSPKCPIRSIVTQGVQAGIRGNDLKQLKIHLPPIEIQNRIADIISAYDDLIENNRRRIQLLERSLHLLYKEWFVHLRFPSHEHSKIVEGIPEGWQTGTVADFYKTSSGGTPSRKRPEFFTGEINWVKTQELNEGFIFSSDEKITEEAVKCSSAKIFPEETVLVAMYGATIGQTAILAVPAATNQACCGIIPNHPNAHYIHAFLFFRENKQGLMNLSQGSAQNNISQEIIKTYPMVLPTEMLMAQFVDYSKPVFRQIKNLSLQNRQLQQARDLLLPKLMSGAISV